MERRITREFGAWGAGVLFLCLNSLGVSGLKGMSSRDLVDVMMVCNCYVERL